MTTERLTMAQALVKFLQAQYVLYEDEKGGVAEWPLFAGTFAIFGHGNVAGLGEALADVQTTFPTYRAHNEQSMAFAAVAFAKQHRRQRMMAVTTSIGPGATNLITAAGVAHANRLPVLFLPGDTFSSRTPDPVLQQVEHFGEPGVTVNDAFRPVSRYFDRINRPEQIITSAVQAVRTLVDPAECGPVTLALPQDVQAESFDYPITFFRKRVWRKNRPIPDAVAFEEALAMVFAAKKPLLVAGGGVHYATACQSLRKWVEATGIPVAETQAGKGALHWQHPQALGSMGVTGSRAANQAAADADLIIAVGTRLQDFTTGSRTLFNQQSMLSINVAPFDANKHEAHALVGDARVIVNALSEALQASNYRVSEAWQKTYQAAHLKWQGTVETVTALPESRKKELPSDAQIIGVVNRWATAQTTVVCAAGGMPGELHKLWRTEDHQGYHVEYGYSCMGYEIAGGLGAKMATPEREIVVMVGDGSYMMLNSEIATSVMLGQKLIIVVVDNRGFGCINRLQQRCGGEPFNNLFEHCLTGSEGAPYIDFAAHAQAMGAHASWVENIKDLSVALDAARQNTKTTVVCLRADAAISTQSGGAWWDVAVPETTVKPKVDAARKHYVAQKQRQPY